MVLAVQFYDAVVALHVMAILIAFGPTFAYPLLLRTVRASSPSSLPAFHRAQVAVGKRIIAPVGGIALLLGAYLASDRDLWGEVWVNVPLVILVLLLGAGGAFFSPQEEKAATLAERDGGTPSAEYEAVAGRLQSVGLAASGLVLLAVYFMVAKPFA